MLSRCLQLIVIVLLCHTSCSHPVSRRDSGGKRYPSRARAKHGLLFHSFRPAWPAEGILVSGFGPRGNRHHDGIDIAAPTGTAVRSIAPGKVVFVGWKRGYGRVVVVRHKNYQSLYAHLRRFRTSRGRKVRKGSLIGTVGTSGNARGAHLHFEIQSLKGRPMDPLGFLPPDGRKWNLARRR